MPQEKAKVIPVMVALRCRPLIEKEKQEGCKSCINTVPGEPQIILGKDRAFTYDFSFGPTEPQSEVYEKACKKLISSIFKGYNATILAYGQTGSGKTHTMGGCYVESLEGDEEAMGVIPRVLRDIFQHIEDAQDIEFSVRVSYMEIYNEELIDLLCPPTQRESLVIRDEGNAGIKLHGLKEVKVSNFTETMKFLSQGSEGRTTGATAMNTTSSRSHAIFTLNIDQTKKDIGDCCSVKFHLVDLAGSERCSRTKAEGERFREGVNINKGLLSLGKVISALGDESQKKNFIPYRDSKLTRILQDSLGGNSHTLMIACVSPADSNIEETLNTLRYADNVRKIKNKPVINRDPQAAEIMNLKLLVQQLQSQLIQGGTSLTSIKSDTNNSCSSTFTATSNEELEKLKDKVKSLESENDTLIRELQQSVASSTSMLDKVIKLEASNERLKLRLSQVKDYVGIDLDLLSSSIDVESNPMAKAELEKLSKLSKEMKEGDRENEDKEEEDDLKDDEEEEDSSFGDDNKVDDPDTLAFRQKHALHQAEMQRQLTEITRSLNSKQALAEKMTESENKEMENMKTKYDEMMAEWKVKTEQLEKEKEQLAQTLQSAKVSANAMKVSEKRRLRLKELEQEMSRLKKKMAEQTRVVKLKESSDKQVSKLNVEIHDLKAQRVKLIKQMKVETSDFQKWKREKTKEVNQLQQRDRKRDFEVQRLKKDFERQQTVQKRKTAEAVAANKRLRENLEKQNQVQNERTRKQESCDSASIGNRVRKWLSHELDVKVSIRETKYHLATLMDNRKQLTEQKQQLKDRLEGGPLQQKFSWLGENGDKDEISFEEKEIQKQIDAIELDIELINVHIEQHQQMIVEADQESKGKSTWQNLHTMMEAKCAMKFLLEQAINAKADHMKINSDLKDVQDKEKEEEQNVKELKAELSNKTAKHEREIARLKTEYEERFLVMLEDPKKANAKPSNKLSQEKMKLLEAKVARLETEEKAHEDTKQELEEMKRTSPISCPQQMTNMMYQSGHYRLLPDLEKGTSPFLDLKPKLDATTSSLNSTFVCGETVEEEKPVEQEKPVEPVKRQTRLSRAKKNAGADESENDLSRSSRANLRKKTFRLTKKVSEQVLEDENNDPVSKTEEFFDKIDTTDDKDKTYEESTKNKMSSSLLRKRRSGEDISDSDGDTSQDRKKKRKRTLLCSSTTSSYFGNLDL